MDNQIAYKFVEYEVPSLESLSNSFAYMVKSKLLKGVELTREEKNRLAHRLSVSMSESALRLSGWEFSFKDLLNEYWVRFTYGTIYRFYAPDKTSLCSCLRNIDRIVEVTKAKKFS
jgi:hypothetical protein